MSAPDEVLTTGDRSIDDVEESCNNEEKPRRSGRNRRKTCRDPRSIELCASYQAESARDWRKATFGDDCSDSDESVDDRDNVRLEDERNIPDNGLGAWGAESDDDEIDDDGSDDEINTAAEYNEGEGDVSCNGDNIPEDISQDVRSNDQQEGSSLNVEKQRNHDPKTMGRGRGSRGGAALLCQPWGDTADEIAQRQSHYAQNLKNA